MGAHTGDIVEESCHPVYMKYKVLEIQRNIKEHKVAEQKNQDLNQLLKIRLILT